MKLFGQPNIIFDNRKQVSLAVNRVRSPLKRRFFLRICLYDRDSSYVSDFTYAILTPSRHG